MLIRNQIPPFCGKPVSTEDFQLIQEILQTYSFSRVELANTVAELLNWTRPNGKLKERETVEYLEKCEALGLVRLPALRNTGSHKGHHTGSKRTQQGDVGEEISCSLKELYPIELEQIDTKKDREHWRELIDRYHYLGYKRPFGGRILYFIRSRATNQLLGCLQVSSAAWALERRDHWLGWDQATRKANLSMVVQNSRFLILPWVKVKGLASHALSLLSKRIADDWERHYAVRPVLMESFVDTTCFEGTCYRAANWIDLGETKGRGRMDAKHRNDRSIKRVWVYPLHRHFKITLTEVP